MPGLQGGFEFVEMRSVGCTEWVIDLQWHL